MAHWLRDCVKCRVIYYQSHSMLPASISVMRAVQPSLIHFCRINSTSYVSFLQSHARVGPGAVSKRVNV